MSLRSVQAQMPIYVVILDGNDLAIACGELRTLEPKQVRAVFNMRGVSGSVGFTQNSPWDATRIDIALNGLRGVAGPYHVNGESLRTRQPMHGAIPHYAIPRTEFPIGPISPHIDEDTNVCAAQFTGEHWNPLRVEIARSPPPSQGTHDQYEVGDLSGKHGLISGAVQFSSSFFDDSLPLFGRNSIVGRCAADRESCAAEKHKVVITAHTQAARS